MSAVIESLERRIETSADILKYIRAGKAVFTLRSVETGKRFTYRVVPSKYKAGEYMVALMTGPDNEGSFTFLGLATTNGFHWTPKYAHMSATPAFGAFLFTYRWLLAKPSLTPKIEFWHSGRCGRCGRRLTVPESIAAGIGPECAGKM